MPRPRNVAKVYLFAAIFFCLLSSLSSLSLAQSNANHPTGPNGIVVKSKFGFQIFGYDIDQNGTEGVLAEALLQSNGNVLAAVETFNQKTGKITKVLTQTDDQDDFIVRGVVGTSVGLYEHEHVISFLNVQRTFDSVNPLSGNKITGLWTPPIGTEHLLSEVSHTQGSTNNAILAMDNSGNFITWVFSSDVATNTFGPIVKIQDTLDFGSVPPPMAYDTVTNQAILGGGDGCFGCFPVIGLADLTHGTFSKFTGMGFGFVNGIAVDSADGLFVTDTEDDASVEFYTLSTETGFTVVLPNSGENQIFSGADIEYDPIHKLFLVSQPVSSSTSSGSSIYVYDTNGVLQETLNGFSFSNSFNVFGAYIAIDPSTRTGFMQGPDSGVTELQGFSY